ncbi:MAG: helix-turn-helix domain-containing protein [Eubacterium sp.]|nr:helix-turn-helix domain-containing protein [Eubacterium sp.]
MPRVIRAQGLSDRVIAKVLNRSHTTISREFARNSREDGTYSANYADKRYAERRKNCGRKPILENETAKNYVIKKLEQQPFSFSYPTIYRAIDKGILPQKLKKNYAFQAET